MGHSHNMVKILIFQELINFNFFILITSIVRMLILGFSQLKYLIVKTSQNYENFFLKTK